MDTLPPQLMVPGTTISGKGCIKGLLPKCAELGKRGLLVHGSSLREKGELDIITTAAPRMISLLTHEHTGGEPSLESVEDLREKARLHQADWIAGVGGGSVMDLAKAAAGLFHCSHDVTDYHRGAPIERPGIPFIAAPTTAGTGSEATIVCVLTDKQRKLKKSIRHPSFMARAVFLDPELLDRTPRQVIAYAGVDAFVQAIESFFSINSTWWSETLSFEGIISIASSLLDTYHKPSSPDAERLLTGSYLTGIALSSSRLGVVHGLVHPLGALYDLPHGLLCGITLAPALELNKPFFKTISTRNKYGVVSSHMGNQDLIEFTHELLSELQIDENILKGKEIIEKDRIIAETLASGSTKANPKTISAGDVEFLLERLFAV